MKLVDAIALPFLYCEEHDIVLTQCDPTTKYWQNRKASWERSIPTVDKPGKITTIPHDDPRLLTCKFAPPTHYMGEYMTVGYFGSQRITYPGLRSILPEKPGKYCDLTAGGCSVPYLLRKDGWDVSVNDFGYLSHIIGKAMIDSGDYVKKKHPNFEPTKDFEGTSFKTETVLKGKSPEFAKWLDGFVKHYENSPLHLAGLGKAILNKLTFRGLVPDKSLVRSVVPGVMRFYVWKAYCSLQTVLLDPKKNGPGKAIWGDATETSKTHDWSDTIMYADPAWAWGNGTMCEAYEWYANDVAKVLLQEKHTPRSFWTGAKGEDAIKDVTNWIANTLEKGAKAFILNTQSTNAPNPVDLCEGLVQKLGTEFVKLNAFASVSRAANKPFVEWYFCVGNCEEMRNVFPASREKAEYILKEIEKIKEQAGDNILKEENTRLVLTE